MNNHSARTKGKSAARRANGGKGKGPTAGKNGGRKASTPAAPEGKRERILDAAIKVFAAEGFYNAKVSQIAQLAGVADGTIYLYFKSKDDLLINRFEDRMGQGKAKVREGVATDSASVSRLGRIVKLHLELVEA